MSGRGGIGRRASFRYSYPRVWEFKSPRPHLRQFSYEVNFKIFERYDFINMKNLIIYLGYIYILMGSIFLFIPLIYLELGRPKDLIKAALNLLIGVILIIKFQVFENFSFAIFLIFTILICLYIQEAFSLRWNQLTDEEKNKLTTLSEFKNNLSKMSEAILLGANTFKGLLNFFRFDQGNQNAKKKKWVRNDKNDNIKF